MIKGLIFDLDGTLLYTLPDLTKAINQTMDELHLKHQTMDDVRNKIGSGFKVLLSKCVPETYTDEEINKAVELYSHNYGLCYMEETKVYAGINELVNWCITNNLKLGVNSNKKDTYTKDLIKLHFPKIDQRYVYGKREGYPIKPNPSNNLEILKEMNLNNNEVLYIGDSGVDIKTGRNTNLKVIAVTWGYRDKELLEKENPDYLINKPKEIIKIIKEMNGE